VARATTILIARHGESDWNVEGRWQGHADRPLSERGRDQAAALAERLVGKGVEAIYSSDLRRARETAETVGARLGLPVRARRELREVDVGSWSGLTRAEAEERFPDGFARWQAGGAGWEDGEVYEDMSDRIVTAVRRIAAEHQGGRVLVVTHGGPIRALHAAALGLDVQTYRRMRPVEPNARLSAVCVEDGRFSELSGAQGIDDLLARDQEERAEATRERPTPAG
jgi:probable phosphoglycerate mutase